MIGGHLKLHNQLVKYFYSILFCIEGTIKIYDHIYLECFSLSFKNKIELKEAKF